MARMFIGEGRGFGARESTDLSNVMTQNFFRGDRMSAGYFYKISNSQANVIPSRPVYTYRTLSDFAPGVGHHLTESAPTARQCF